MSDYLERLGDESKDSRMETQNLYESYDGEYSDFLDDYYKLLDEWDYYE